MKKMPVIKSSDLFKGNFYIFMISEFFYIICLLLKVISSLFDHNYTEISTKTMHQIINLIR